MSSISEYFTAVLNQNNQQQNQQQNLNNQQNQAQQIACCGILPAG